MSEETRYIGKSASYLFNKASASRVQENSSCLDSHRMDKTFCRTLIFQNEQVAESERSKQT